MQTLEEKILEAKQLGIKFSIVPVGQGSTHSAFGTMNVLQTYSDSEFEKELDIIIKNYKSKKYLKLLKDNGLI